MFLFEIRLVTNYGTNIDNVSLSLKYVGNEYKYQACTKPLVIVLYCHYYELFIWVTFLWFVLFLSVETLYSTIYSSKYFIELNNDKSTQYVALWTHKRPPYLALLGELWSVFYEYFNRNWSCYKGFLL